jgi:hypothetical protein
MQPFIGSYMYVDINIFPKNSKNSVLQKRYIFSFMFYFIFTITEFGSIKGLPPNESRKTSPQVPLKKCRVRYGVKY